jgi:uncharacterized protein YbaR (Trm112 family)
MPLRSEMLAVLACPKSHQPLIYFEGGERGDQPEAAFLLSPAGGLRYRIEGEFAVLLVDEAETLAPAEVERLLGRAKELGIDLGRDSR